MDVKELSGLRGAEIRGIKVRFSPKPTARFSRRDMARDDQSVTRAAETSHVKLRMARPTGFEPVTSAFGGQRSIYAIGCKRRQARTVSAWDDNERASRPPQHAGRPLFSLNCLHSAYISAHHAM
jgi:hypothetical protein